MPPPRREEATVFLGDILPTPEQVDKWVSQVEGCEDTMDRPGKGKGRRSRREILYSQSQMWTSRVIPVTISTSDPPSSTIALLDSNGNLVGGTLKDAIDYIASKTCLTFNFFPPGTAAPAYYYIIVQADNTDT